MKDTNNKPITEEEFTKGESVRVEMPVEKTVEELYDLIPETIKTKLWGIVGDTEKCVELYEIISKVKQQVRREVVEELKGLKVYVTNINEGYATTFEAKAVYMVDDVMKLSKGIIINK